MISLHYRTKPGCFETSNDSLPHVLVSDRASEQMNERSGASERSKQGGASKKVSGESEKTSEWPSTHVPILDCSEPSIESNLMALASVSLYHECHIYQSSNITCP